ncbi:MAG: DUF4405 domain-containing protein [Elusimicrobia bacterium]|nr:DUF4405 domain-containing protein [Elusimicrobiota bacterium]
MNKILMLRIVNLLLLITFAVMAATGIFFSMEIRVPFMKTLLAIHEFFGLLMVGLVIAHISLNWGWIKANFLKKRNIPGKTTL